jgi:hypothetical protein
MGRRTALRRRLRRRGRVPEIQHIVKDANGWDYFVIVGQIGERYPYRVNEGVEKVRRVEYWNGRHWTEVVVLAIPDYSTGEAIALAHRIVSGWGDAATPPPSP